MAKKPKDEPESVTLMLKKRLRWRLDSLMRDRGIRTSSELQSRLKSIGMELSRAQVARVIAERPARINADLLDALINILDCSIGDLMVIEDVSGPNPPPGTPEESKPAPRKKTVEKLPRNKPLLGSEKKELEIPGLGVVPRPIRSREGMIKRPKVVVFPEPYDIK